MARRPAAKTVAEPVKNENIQIETKPTLRYSPAELHVQRDKEGDLAFFKEWDSADDPCFVVDAKDVKDFIEALKSL